MTWLTFLTCTLFQIYDFNLWEQVTSFNLSFGFIFTKISILSCIKLKCAARCNCDCSNFVFYSIMTNYFCHDFLTFIIMNFTLLINSTSSMQILFSVHILLLSGTLSVCWDRISLT